MKRLEEDQSGLGEEQKKQAEEMERIAKQVEMGEKHSRRLNLKVFGFTAKETLQGKEQYKEPVGCFKSMLMLGMGMAKKDVDAIQLRECHWAAQGKFLIVNFVRDQDRRLVLSKRKSLGENAYKPDGRAVSLQNDFTAKQMVGVKEATRVYKLLKEKKVKVSTVNDKIKYEGKLYETVDPVIVALLGN
ncbi:MAG: hypothetical protein GY858_08285 [Candidatus Omnitrophica bacterium]|nr:hypothetical protein [Candidatus Omnitrophota bacterium]